MRKSNKEELATKASLNNRLEYILMDYFSFRVQMTFKNEKKVTLYGHEHSCTYQQCLHQHVPNIILNKMRGYAALLEYIERKKNQYTKAVLYMREPGHTDFNKLCRRYYNGEMEDSQDPVLTGAEELQLQYQIINGRVVIRPPDQLAPVITDAAGLPDFKAEIEKNLLK